MKDTTTVVVALTVAGIFASALLIPQFVMSQSTNTGGLSYYQDRKPEASGRMMPGGMMGPGMMRGTPTMPSQTYGNYSQGRGMMDGYGMMGGMPMMKGMMGYYSGVPTPLSHDDAKAIASEYLASLNNPDFRIDEFEEYSHNFYVSIVEKSTGRGAIEIILDRYSGTHQPEPQSMMWNTKYHLMGMMGGYSLNSASQAEMTVTPEQATKIAQGFLSVVLPGTETGEIVSYYGYYTTMTTLSGEHYGMLSVNGYSGDVWYHTWHGMFISELE